MQVKANTEQYVDPSVSSPLGTALLNRKVTVSKVACAWPDVFVCGDLHRSKYIANNMSCFELVIFFK